MHLHHHHGHEHKHDDHHDHHHHIAKDSRALKIAIFSTGTIFIAQIIGGIISHSLALLSDAGHMLTDVGALLIAFIALRYYAARHGDAARLQKFTFGIRRIEVLAAMVNGIILFGMCAYLIYEAIMRIFHPEEVHTEPMLIVSVIGLIANIISAIALHRSHHLSTRSAYLHVITDLLSSVSVIIGGIIIYYTHWEWIDTLLSAGIAIFILRSAFRLMKSAGIILMDSAPAGITQNDIQKALLSVPGVQGVHDIHVWQINPGKSAVSAHLSTALNDHGALLSRARAVLQEQFGIDHSTLQIEDSDYSHNHGCDHCSVSD
jgi:cobalt-zinc-cadmium efflux system protein